MLKTSVKVFLLFTLLVATSLTTGFVTYTVTKRIIEEKAVTAQKSAEPYTRTETTVPTQKSDLEAEKDTAVQFEYYIVRLEGNDLSVYVSHNGAEEFLYTERVYKNNLSSQDISTLEAGVKLNNSSELTGFIENFTS